MLITLFLAGDVMTGRGLDQILPHPNDPGLLERAIRDARDYVALAEEHSSPIPRPVPFAYPWGVALDELAQARPAARIVNLETSVTTSAIAWPDKEVRYRMHPRNVACLAAAGIDVCALANNHVLDYGYAGLVETLDTLHAAGIATAGAGRTLTRARQPATVALEGGGRLHVLAIGAATSGIPEAWAATDERPGVDWIGDLDPVMARELEVRLLILKQPGHVVVCSIHWGSNWGYPVPPDQVRFAHQLVDAGVDVIHGHSSHHPRPVEVYRGRLILYGCGDLLNDYEGIGGFEAFRGDLALLYFVTLDTATGELVALRLVPVQLRGMRLERPSEADRDWLAARLTRVCQRHGAHVELEADGSLALRWQAGGEEGVIHVDDPRG